MAKDREVSFDNIAPPPDPELLPEYGVDELPLTTEAVDPPAPEVEPTIKTVTPYDTAIFKNGSLIEVLDGEAPAAALPLTVVSVTYASPLTIDLSLGDYFKVTLGGNAAITLSNPLSTGRKYQIALKQDGTGSRVPTWSTTIKWKGGTAPTLTTTANKTDIVTLVYDGTDYYGDIVKNF